MPEEWKAFLGWLTLQDVGTIRLALFLLTGLAALWLLRDEVIAEWLKAQIKHRNARARAIEAAQRRADDAHERLAGEVRDLREQLREVRRLLPAPPVATDADLPS